MKLFLAAIVHLAVWLFVLGWIAQAIGHPINAAEGIASWLAYWFVVVNLSIAVKAIK